MSDPKDFLSRWSRRKLESVESSDPAPVEKTALTPSEMPRAETPAAANAMPVPEFDLTKLPSLESIGANSDITAFLQRGVPASLTRAALRRAWSADSAIRDFIGLSENSWDFTAPDSMPGFGSLDAGEVKRLAMQLFGEPAEDAVGHSSENRNSLVQSASDVRESETARAHEMRKAALEESGIPDEGEVQRVKIPSDKDRRADMLSAANQPEEDGAAQYQEDRDQDQLRPVPRRHGGALPE